MHSFFFLNSSSGANLTKVNHAIMLHSLYTETAQEYHASETQAIGRIKRYGQQRLVHVWRILANDSVDTKIYEERVKVSPLSPPSPPSPFPYHKFVWTKNNGNRECVFVLHCVFFHFFKIFLLMLFYSKINLRFYLCFLFYTKKKKKKMYVLY